MAPKSGSSMISHPSSDVEIHVSNKVGMYNLASAWVLVGMTTPLCSTVDIFRFFTHAVLMAQGLFVGERRAFDMIELRGNHYLYVVIGLLILEEFGYICRLYPDVYKFALQAMTNNISLNSLAKIINLHAGPIRSKEGADEFEAAVGQIEWEGEARARELVKQIFLPLVGPAVRACVESLRNELSPSVSATPPSTASFTFSFRNLPAEASAKGYAHLVPAVIDPSSASAHLLDSFSEPSSSIGHSQASFQGQAHAPSSKRRREEEESLADETEVTCLLLGEGAGAEVSASAERNGAPPALLEPPLKRRHLGEAPVKWARDADKKFSKEKRRAGNRKRQGTDIKKVITPDSLVEPICRALDSLPAGRLAFSCNYSGPSLYGSTIDAAMGQDLVKYYLVAALTDVWADHGMSAHAAATAIEAMVSEEVVNRIARALGMVEHVDFLRAVARASREISFDFLRTAVLDVYRDVAPVAIELVKPLYIVFSSESLEPTRDHLRNVLLIQNAGYTYRSNLSRVEAVLSTNARTIQQLFHKDLLRGLNFL
ncbi:uncharacterized protein SCHCODRAFT_02634228 [Schizophyllum commune H4-8]|uniref:Expressed protein n=1 Tax=Schizophyllum commune (strain H4-8 / FGSC 9210) TaxID=578458 RepID=D8QBW3_SCHCM|nr:uncharacterized protein SCHCODRAFT_02634228 [Schizophyllum commune H4-8]KAI5889340.1 hypothetical protein SCHCODRAFT_02634228 [Schizophyllum commune H4-8]